jgi:DNA (cytosine-5)-methyltransferase 1
LWFPPRACQHIGKASSVNSRDENGKRILETLDNYQYLTIVGKGFKVADAQIAMDIDWMTQKELSQAIPPAYTEWLGKQMLKLLTG